MELDRFARHRQADEEERHHDEADDRQERGQSSQGPPPAQSRDVTPLEREEDGCHHRRPEHGHEEASDERQEGERRQGDEDEERDVLDRRPRAVSGLAEPSLGTAPRS